MAVRRKDLIDMYQELGKSGINSKALVREKIKNVLTKGYCPSSHQMCPREYKERPGVCVNCWEEHLIKL